MGEPGPGAEKDCWEPRCKEQRFTQPECTERGEGGREREGEKDTDGRSWLVEPVDFLALSFSADDR